MSTSLELVSASGRLREGATASHACSQADSWAVGSLPCGPWGRALQAQSGAGSRGVQGRLRRAQECPSKPAPRRTMHVDSEPLPGSPPHRWAGQADGLAGSPHTPRLKRKPARLGGYETDPVLPPARWGPCFLHPGPLGPHCPRSAEASPSA